MVAPCGVLWVSDAKNPGNRKRLSGPELKIQTVHSSKGLEFRAVILAFADRFNPRFDDIHEDDERRLTFVGLTRAEDYLAITGTHILPWRLSV